VIQHTKRETPGRRTPEPGGQRRSSPASAQPQQTAAIPAWLSDDAVDSPEITAPMLTWLQAAAGNRAAASLMRRADAAPNVRHRPASDAIGVQRQQGADADADPVAPTSQLAQTAMGWIDDVWGALNQGLADFQQNAQVADWEAFSLSTLGNLIWASAAFATGGGAFLISLAGIGLAAAPTAAAGVSSGHDFYTKARAENDAYMRATKARVPAVTERLHTLATQRNATGATVYRVLMRLLLKHGFFDVVGGVPTVATARIAAHVEEQLHLRTGATTSTDWAGWQHGGWWVEYAYRVDDALDPMLRAEPFSGWRLSREEPNAHLYPLDTEPRNARARLNALRQELGGQHQPATWPLEKRLRVYVRGSYAIIVSLDGGNRVVGTSYEYLSSEAAERLRAAAGWSDLGSGLVRWIWAASGGVPVPIDTLL
jgi:hypothetical protein